MAAVEAVNKDVLKWARERAGLTVPQVAEALAKSPEVVAAWESGESAPTYGQLEKLAYQLYKRPLAVFFFPAPPEETDPRAEFRLLPDFELEALEADTLLAARQARSVQEDLREITGGRNPVPSLLKEVDARSFSNIEALCARVRELLGVDLDGQKSWGSVSEAFKHWRSAVEERGIYVFKRSFKQRDISGFCLYDEEFPVIYINNSTSDSRQIFSLFHELAHLLYAASGITKEGPSYLEALPPDERQIEIACNRFAALLLVPQDDLAPHLEEVTGTDEEVARLAALYSVSREVVLRRLLDLGRVDQEYYERKAAQWNREYENRQRGEGGNYYATQATYLSKSFTRLAFATYYERRCSFEELAGYLGMKAKNVENFESFLMQPAA